jgi:16S rRNA (adenine1518-N6/adenine1519-N6)-dimethyltransferase
VLRPLLDFLAPRGATVLEVGPGDGVLTRELLGRGAARVLAVELDPAWAFRLRATLPSRDLHLAVADAVALRWPALAGGIRVAGNLPYNAGTAILERLLLDAAETPRAAFLLQREVVERIVAGPGEPEYGSLSVIVAAVAEARRLGVVRPGSFVPPPKVDGAFVGLLPRAGPVPPAARRRFAGAVRVAFAAPRKTLRNALAAAWGRTAAEAVLAAAGVEPGARAGELGIEQHAALFRAAEARGMLGSNP